MSLTRFKDLYQNSVKKDLIKEYGYSNIHNIPEIKKVVVTTSLTPFSISQPDLKEGIKKVKDICVDINNSKHKTSQEKMDQYELRLLILSLITGQLPTITKAKKDISTFKLRKGMKIGCVVTLRKDRMYSFLERLVLTALPNVRDFLGFSSKSFDGSGNFTIGIKDALCFPEVDYDSVSSSPFGLNISIITSAKTNKEAKSLLSGLYFPFNK